MCEAIKTVELPLMEALDVFVYDFLTSKHIGWENNEGGYGSCEIDILTGEAVLHHYSRYIETEYSEDYL